MAERRERTGLRRSPVRTNASDGGGRSKLRVEIKVTETRPGHDLVEPTVESLYVIRGADDRHDCIGNLAKPFLQQADLRVLTSGDFRRSLSRPLPLPYSFMLSFTEPSLNPVPFAAFHRFVGDRLAHLRYLLPKLVRVHSRFDHFLQYRPFVGAAFMIYQSHYIRKQLQPPQPLGRWQLLESLNHACQKRTKLGRRALALLDQL